MAPYDSDKPKQIPRIPPSIDKTTASTKNCSKTSLANAPMANRVPTSRVRSVTQKGTATGSTMLEETVAFGFKRITWTHSEQGSQGSLLGGPVSTNYEWDQNR